MSANWKRSRFLWLGTGLRWGDSGTPLCPSELSFSYLWQIENSKHFLVMLLVLPSGETESTLALGESLTFTKVFFSYIGYSGHPHSQLFYPSTLLCSAWSLVYKGIAKTHVNLIAWMPSSTPRRNRETGTSVSTPTFKLHPWKTDAPCSRWLILNAAMINFRLSTSLEVQVSTVLRRHTSGCVYSVFSYD